MQVLRCLLRSRQDLATRSISAALQHTTALSIAAYKTPDPANFSSKAVSGITSYGFHARDSSFTVLSKQLERFVLFKAPTSGLRSHGGACIGWTRQNVYNAPNVISVARLVSGPVIAWLVLSEQWGVALVSLAISGASDWADGYVAKRYNQSSVLGSYLDPLADKVLIGCLVGALGYQGSLPGPLVALIIGRDVVLLSGAFALRFRALGWKWPGLAEFFRVASSPSSPAATQTATPQQPPSTADSAQPGSTDMVEIQDARHASKESNTVAVNPEGALPQGSNESQVEQAAMSKSSIPPAVFVQPLYISKVNTCFQLLLVGGCLSSSWYAWPPQEAILVLGIATGGLTLASCAAYVSVFFKGSIK